MEKLKVAFTGYADYVNTYREVLKNVDLSRIDTGYFEIHPKLTKYVEGNDWLIVDDFDDFKRMDEFPFEGLLNKELLIIHAASGLEDTLTNFYFSAAANRGIVFYFWKSQRDFIQGVKEGLRNIATCRGLAPYVELPENILFGLVPPSSIEDLLELKEGRVPERLLNPELE